MPKRIDYQLSDEQVQLIDDAIKHAPEPEVRQRAMAVKLLHVGHSAQEVAEMMAVELVSIYNWHKRWVAEGIAGLKNRPRSGRPTKADQSYRDLLAEVIEQDPQAREAAQQLLDWLKKTPSSTKPSSFSLWTKRP